MIKKVTFLIFFSVFFGLLSLEVFAQEETSRVLQEETLEGKIVKILEEEIVIQAGEQNLYQELEVLITKGSLKDEKVIVEVGNIPLVGRPKYKEGEHVLISYSQDFEGNPSFYIADYLRRQSLLWLFLAFVVLTTVVAGWRGISSLLGMALSFLVIFQFILPKISIGVSPILAAITGSLFIIPITFCLSHGLNQKTTIAIVGTIISLIITGILASMFVDAAKLTGFASEEAGFLQVVKQGTVNMKGLLLAGIIIGVLGVLDDITISQAAIVHQLREANPKLKPRELYRKAMDVGKDHISSMVNTLVLVYTGAALPLLLLFINSPRPFLELINYEIVADEIVRTLVGSLGLILAVPITTFFASLAAKRHVK
jgi:uncharacterized membrane protein